MSNLVVGSTLKEFFRMLVGEVVSRQKVTLGEVTEFYVVNLLSEFAEAEKLLGNEPLAVLYHQAMQQERDQKIRTLRKLGDVSLYTAGFFSDSLRDRVVGPDYYIQMGGTAYGAIAQMSSSSSFSSVYWELHQKFRTVVEVLEEIAARGMAAQGPGGQVKVLESFTRSGSERLGQVLLDAGVMPRGPVH